MSAILPPRHPLGVARARQPRARGARRSGRAVRPGWPLLLVLLLGALVPGGCRGTLPGEETPTGVSLTLDIVPLILRADTTQTAAVWVTILDGGAPIADSTRVSLVATLGRVSAEAYTIDGLAVGSYRAASEAGQALIIAQARGVRDTMRVTLY